MRFSGRTDLVLSNRQQLQRSSAVLNQPTNEPPNQTPSDPRVSSRGPPVSSMVSLGVSHRIFLGLSPSVSPGGIPRGALWGTHKGTPNIRMLLCNDLGRLGWFGYHVMISVFRVPSCNKTTGPSLALLHHPDKNPGRTQGLIPGGSRGYFWAIVGGPGAERLSSIGTIISVFGVSAGGSNGCGIVGARVL